MMQLRGFQEADAALLLELDRRVYPTDDPVTCEVLKSWYRSHPQFGMIYEKDGDIVGVLLVIALTPEGWRKLTEGSLAESAVDGSCLFDAARGDTEIGLHVYHLEKLSEEMSCFHEQAFQDLGKLVRSLPASETRVVGLSALAVTPGGLWLFGHKLNFREREALILAEHILVKREGDPPLEVFEGSTWDELRAKLAQEAAGYYKYRNRCQMLVLLPGEPSVVWLHFEK